MYDSDEIDENNSKQDSIVAPVMKKKAILKAKETDKII